MTASPPSLVGRRRAGRGVSRWRAGGSVYLLVLATTSMVAVLGVAGLFAGRLERASAALQADATLAASLASSGLAAAINRLGRDAAWAAAPGEGWSAEVALGEGAYRLRVQADPDSPGRHRLSVRATVGTAVRLLEAEAVEPQRLGPELLANPRFAAGFHPTTHRGSDAVAIDLEEDPTGQRFVEVRLRASPSDGIQQQLSASWNSSSTYRLGLRARVSFGADNVRIGFIRQGAALLTESVDTRAVGTAWTDIEVDLEPPAALVLSRPLVFVTTVSGTADLEVASWSLREILPPRPAEITPGSRAWVADTWEPPGA